MQALAAKEEPCTASAPGLPPPTALLAARVVDNGKAEDVPAAPGGSTELVAALQVSRANEWPQPLAHLAR